MVSRSYYAVALLLIHAAIVSSFSRHHAANNRGESSTMISNVCWMGRPLLLLRQLTHHHHKSLESSSSCLCFHHQQHSHFMDRGYHRRRYNNNCNMNNCDSIHMNTFLGNNRHQQRRWLGTLKSSTSNYDDDIITTTASSMSNNISDESYSKEDTLYDQSMQSADFVENDPERNTLIIDSNGGTAQHWFTYSLPEGYCVGVITSSSTIAQSEATNTKDDDTTEIIQSSEGQLLHPEEYKWGVTNLSGESSRTCYYLGRVALRLALKRLLLSNDDDTAASTLSLADTTLSSIMERMDQPTSDTQMQQYPSALQKTNLHKAITSNPIQKDSHGRPILPEMLVGSISHKGGECAVGLASFHPLFFDSLRGGSNLDEVESMIMDGYGKSSGEIQWREDCPIYYDDDEDDVESTASNTSNSNREMMGIGVDIEYVDGVRGERLQRKVLTENERNELGGLVEKFGISIGEEVMLRFR